MRVSNRLTLLLLMLPLLLPALAGTAGGDSAARRKKVAVVLSGGGAYGAIHVGALKVLEQSGIPIDMVVGTSMGSIVGSLYSVGYSSDDLATMLRTTEWDALFLETDDPRHLTLDERDDRDTYMLHRLHYVGRGTDPQPGGLLRGNKVEHTLGQYFYGYTDSIDFLRDLPRQFACIAADLPTNRQVVLTSGSLARSVRASMSIPGVFTPVHIGDQELVDGGMKNNFAADVARQLGADIVIGVKFDRQLDTVKHYRKIIDVLERSAGGDVSRRSRECEKLCDLVVRVPVRGYSSGNFTRAALDSLMARGERAMREKFDTILQLKQAATGDTAGRHTMHLRDLDDARQALLEPPGLIDRRLPGTAHLAVGLRYDSEDYLAAMLGARLFDSSHCFKGLGATLRLGARSMLRLSADIEPREHRSLGASYQIGYNAHGLNTGGRRSDNLSYLHQQATVTLFKVDLVNFDCEIGLGWDHFHHFRRLWNSHSTCTLAANEHYFIYHARVRYDSRDDSYLPHRGVKAEATYEYCTDDFARWKGHSGFSAVAAGLCATIPLSPGTHLLPGVQGRLLFGDDLPAMAGNVAGGAGHVRFFGQQLSIAGLGYAEFYDSKLVSASLRVQQRLAGRHYLVADASATEQSHDVDDLFGHKPTWGAQLGYCFRSPVIGPLGAALGWNSGSKRLNFIVALGYCF